jgi:hypothetical protein
VAREPLEVVLGFGLHTGVRGGCEEIWICMHVEGLVKKRWALYHWEGRRRVVDGKLVAMGFVVFDPVDIQLGSLAGWTHTRNSDD